MNLKMRLLVLQAFYASVAAAPKKASPLALLHQSAASASTVSVHSHARTGDPIIEPIFERGRPLNPQPQGHMLTDSELKPIENIACLEAMQTDPTVNCSDPSQMVISSTSKHLNAGNYPMWKDPRCNSNGEYFCDPDKLLTTKERATLTAEMKKLREGKHITCGPQLQHDPVDKWHYEPFYLGVAIAKDWPQHESDAQSLQSFGRILAGRWNMTFPWDGNPAFYARCPNEAVLIILPEKRQAHLSSSSCMFVCQEKGGPEVATATMFKMESQGLMAGVSAGMSQVYKTIAATSPMHKAGWEPVEKTAGTWSEADQAPSPRVYKASAASVEQNLWDWGQRFFFAFAVLLLAGSVIVAFLVCYLAPGLAKELNKNTDNIDAYHGLIQKWGPKYKGPAV